MQVVDARDLARFTITAISQSLSGPFNMSGHRLTWSDFLHMLGAEPVDLRWVPAPALRSAGCSEREFPLFRPEHGPRASLMHVSNARATAAGLTLTDPAITAHDTRRWLDSHPLQPALSREREAQLLRLAQV